MPHRAPSPIRAQRRAASSRYRGRTAIAVTGLLAAVIVLAGAGPAAASQSTGTSTTSTTTPIPTSTTTAPTTLPAPTTTAATPGTSTTVPSATTTTTTPVPVYANVPAPPPAPLLAVATDPKMLALAAHLERQIAAQATALDKLASQYEQAQARTQTANEQVAAVATQLDGARADEHQADLDTQAALAALRRKAISVYLGTNLSPQTAAGPYGPVYQAGLVHAYSDGVFTTVGQRIQDLRAARGRLAKLRKSIEARTRQAEVAQAKAVAAADQVQADVAAATAEQAKLNATLAKIKGDLAALVIAQRATMAQHVYTGLSGGRTLDFVPGKPLPGLLPQAAAAIAIADAQVGKPYVWGATGPDTFDCSGLLVWSWKQTGIKLPRVAADQQSWATPIPISQVSPGDLVFFGSPAHHVGMYVGNGMMVDAPHSGAFVGIVPIWWNELSGFGRVHT